MNKDTEDNEALSLKKLEADFDSEDEKYSEFPVKLATSPILGRYLVAKRDVKAGEILLRDDPIFTAPNAGEGTCLSCCKKWKDGEKGHNCSKCGWPVCNEKCEEAPIHRDNECPIFAKNSIPHSLPTPFSFVSAAEFVKTVRGILLSWGRSEEDKRRWEVFRSLQAHMDERKSVPKVLFMSKLCKNFVDQLCKMGESEKEKVDFIMGVIDVNAFRHVIHPNNPMRKVHSDIERNATFIYSKGSMAAHGCRRNVRWETMPSGSVEMWAAEDIKENDELSHPYVDLMLGTPDRRRKLKDQFYFDCSCKRCSDPTELGTNFSTLKCQECKTGDVLSVNPLDYETDWKCCSCGHTYTFEYERELVSQIQQDEKTVLEMGQTSSDLAAIGSLARIVGKYRGKKVHQNHFTILDVEYQLVRKMAKMKKSTPDVSNEMRKLIHKFLDIAVVFYPGIK